MMTARRNFRIMVAVGRRASAGRRAQVLIYFILIVFALMSLAALVVDLAFARLTQRQMQSAVDSAALEGMRFRGDLSDDVPDTARQTMVDAVQERIALTFHNNLTLTNTSEFTLTDAGSPNFSAGPLIRFGAETTSVTAASQLLLDAQSAPPQRFEYHPALRANAANESGGDIVIGSYDRDDQIHLEVKGASAAEYARTDFSAGIVTATDTIVSSQADAILVRMRRTDEDFTSLNDSHSSGPPVPALFGRGNLFNRDQIARGTVVRATAIASTTPALTVGFAADEVDPSLPGIIPILMESTYWSSLTTGISNTPSIAEGVITTTSGPVGRSFDLAAFLLQQSELRLAQSLTTSLDAATVDDGVYAGYVPLYSGILNADMTTTDRIVGFGYADVMIAADGTSITLTCRKGRVANGNATSVPHFAAELDAMNESERIQMRTSVLETGESIDGRLVVPCLVRTHGKIRPKWEPD